MANWVRVCSTADCQPGQSRELVADDRVIALFNLEGQFYALDGICRHQGGPLGTGALCGGVVTCPWHGWQFDVTTGQHQTIPSLAQTAFPVKVEGDDVLVDLEE